METTRRTPRRRTVLLLLTIALLNVPAVAVATHVFTDVGDGSVHAPGIHYLQQTGITGGCTATQFCPGDELTRAQMGSFLFRASGNDPATSPSINAATLTAGAVQTVAASSTVVDQSTNGVLVTCPAGTVVIGGGGATDDASWVLRESLPVGDDRWFAIYTRPEGSRDQTASAVARCLTVGP